MIDRINNASGRKVVRQTARTQRPVPAVEASSRTGDRAGDDPRSGAHADRRRPRSRVRHGEIDPSGAPLSSATFITQHIAQERMPARPVDARHGARTYDHRALRPLTKSDLIRRA